jgi:c(7)-type cytochrome triheme protein
MRYLVGLVATLFIFGGFAAEKPAPAKIVLPAKSGNVTFDHAAHAKREKNDCKVCHDKLFQQSKTAPLGFRPPHSAAETKKASCGFCHREGGQAFSTKGNCTNSKCHVRAATKG